MATKYLVAGKALRVAADKLLDVGEEIDVSDWRWQTLSRYLANGHIEKVTTPDPEPAAPRSTKGAKNGQ